MRKAIPITFVFVAAVFLGGCATKAKPLYFYGDYPKSLYKLKKDPSPEHQAKHQKALEKVIEVSKEEDLRVPPGIHCEYGYLLWQLGRHSDAERQFDLEIQTYPEAATFITLLRKTLSHAPSA
jgi:hypothetical protein